jgi:uncharacterized iron-regulated protein
MSKILFSLIFLLLSACTSNSVTRHLLAPSNSQAVESLAHSISVIALKDTKKLDEIIPKLASHKAVLVGESHTRYSDHLNQLAIIKQLRPHWQQMAIGLEFVQIPYQQALDDYIGGKTSEAEMLRETRWYERWKYDFRLYRAIFHYAKQQKIPLLALNTPQEITQRISEVGIKGLTSTERAQLPKQLDSGNQRYRDKLKKVYSRHGGKSRSNKFERFYQAQIAWDETMADQAAKFLTKHPDYHMVILAGSGHMIERHGIPSRLQQRIKTKPAVILHNIEGVPSATQADYLLFSPQVALPKAGKMGIIMQDTANGVLISKVMDNSASAKAGLKKGDLILRLNGKKVTVLAGIKISLLDAKPKQTIELLLQRAEAQKILKTVVLQ